MTGVCQARFRSGRPALRLFAALGVLVGCGAVATPPPAGLARQFQVGDDATADHLGEFVIVDDAVIVTNSNDALTIVQRNSLKLAMPIVGYPELGARCTTIDVHTPSKTLYCASDSSEEILAFDLTTPTHPAFREVVVSQPDMVVADLTVVGDTLWIAHYNAGISRAAIAPSGQIDDHTSVLAGEHVRKIAASEGDLFALTGTRGLIKLQLGEDGQLSEVWQLPLEGPPLDLSLRGRRAVVALGSGGAAVVDLDGPAVEVHVSPRAVVTSGDLDGDALAVSTLTGMYLYDLSSNAPRLAGFVPSGAWKRSNKSGSLLFTRFFEGRLYASDWSYINRFDVDIRGEPRMLDAQRGVYTNANTSISWAVYNPAAQSRKVVFRTGDTVLAEDVLAGETEAVYTTSDLEHFTPGRPTWIFVDVYVEDEITTQYISVLRTDGMHDPKTQGKPAPGMAFPPVRLVGDESETRVDLPLPQRQRVIFYTPDCVAMWPELEDAAYLARSGRLDGGAMPVLIGNAPVFLEHTTSFGDRLQLHGVVRGRDNDPPPDVTAVNEPLEPLYDYGFWIEQLPGGAHHPTDYVVAADGTVVAVERSYRGAYPLRASDASP